jgi:hypothetical protein
MNLRVPQNSGKFSNSCTIGSFSRRAQLHEWVSDLFTCLLNSPQATYKINTSKDETNKNKK